LRSLRHHYAALRGLEEGANQEVFEGTPQFISTPQNYLEKIIQVPFNLRRMDGGSFQRLMESILPFQQDEAPKMEAERAEKALPVSEASASETNADSEIHRAQQERFGQEQETQKSTAVEEYDLLPEALIVRRKEIEFMAELVSLIPTPRAAKRLGNIYRLIRAGVSPAALPQFLGRDQQGGEYQTVLALLAIQVGFPLVANELFARMRRDSPESWARDAVPRQQLS